MAFSFPQLGRTPRLILRYAGFLLLALVTFVFALQLTFPYDRVKSKIEEALSSKYDVTIGGVERGIMPGRVYFNAVTLRTRPTKPDETASTLYIDKLEVDLGIMALLHSTASVKIDAKIATGRIKGSLALNKNGTKVEVEGIDLPAGSLPMKEVLGLPMSGKIELSVSLDLPNLEGKTGKTAPDWTKAAGEFEFECPTGCTFGDGKTKLKPKLKNARSQAFAGDGIEFGKINVDTMIAHVSIKDSKLDLTKFETKSDDGELHIDYSMELAPELTDSQVTGCLRFKGSPGLDKREPRTAAALTTTGAQIGPDGLFHIKLDGRFKDMKRLAQFCGPNVKSADEGGGHGGNARPNLTVQPPDDSLKGGSARAPTPLPAPTPIPAPTPEAPPPPADAYVAPPTPGPVDENNGSAGSAGSGSSTEVPEGRGTAGAGGAGEIR